MNIEHGLIKGQVLQRDKRGKGRARIHGSCRASRDVERRVLKNDRAIRGFGWAMAGAAAEGAFEAEIKNLPTGGPYRVELRIRGGRGKTEQLALEEIFVGDVWVLAGQSNMEGIGNMSHAPKPNPLVRAFYMRDEWGMAKEKLHFLQEAVDVIHNGYGNGPDRPSRKQLNELRRGLIKGVSPGLAFGLDMQERTGIPQGLIPCAHGGTSMAGWTPSGRKKGGASLYGSMMRRYETLGQPVAGMLWYQGESDANPDSVKTYTRRMIELVEATRRDTGLPRLPWVVVQLGCHACAEGGEDWNRIQEQQRLLPEKIPHLDVVPAIDLELDDGIHIGGEGQQTLGRRLARAANRLVHKAPGVKPGIVLKRIAVVPTPNWGPGPFSVELHYGNVVGRLQAGGRPTGFSLINEYGHDVHGIYKTTIHGNKVLLHTGMSREDLGKHFVSYGHGRYPVCTLTDADGMSIPGMKAQLIAPDPA